MTQRTLCKIQFINRFTGALLTYELNLRTDMSEAEKLDYVRDRYVRYGLQPHEKLDHYRLWSFTDTGAFRKAAAA